VPVLGTARYLGETKIRVHRVTRDEPFSLALFSGSLLFVSKFILKPARLLQTRLVTSKTGEPVELDFRQLLAKFLSYPDRMDAMKLMGLRHGAFIGLTKSARTPGKQVVFVLYNENRTGNVDFVLKSDPSFAIRLVEAYRVEAAVYDGVITEAQNPLRQVA
jgi:hypothetical protein